MPPSPPIRLANAFIVAYGTDAVLTLAAVVTDSLAEALWVMSLRRVASGMVFLGALVCGLLLAFGARLPMGLLLTLCGSVLWLASGGAPLALFFDFEAQLPAVLGGIQLALVGLSLLRIRYMNRGENWLLTNATVPGPQFTLRHSLRFVGVMLFVMAPLLAGYVMVSLGTWLEVGTERFVQVNLSGIQLADRRYAQGDREVRLVGMMHLGEDSSYRALTQSFVSEDTIVLEEGVSDEGEVLERGLSYARLARALGLQTQQPMGSYLFAEGTADGETSWPVLRNADVDARVFSNETVKYLGLAAEVWDSDQPMAAFLNLYRHLLEHPEISQMFLYDIIELRNQHLLTEIETALPEYSRVIVPWGALHLPEIERELIESGFVMEDETLRQVIAWSTLVAALF